MPVLLAETLEGRAVTLRLVRSPQPTAAAVVVLALVLLLVLSAAVAAVSVLKVLLHPQQPPMVRAGAETAVLQPASLL